MTNLEDSLAIFGENLGFADFGFDTSGIAQFQMQSGTIFSIERAGNDVYLLLIEMLGFENEEIKTRALQAANFRSSIAFPVQLGLAGNGLETTLFILSRCTAEDITVHKLEEAFEYLKNWYENIRLNHAYT